MDIPLEPSLTMIHSLCHIDFNSQKGFFHFRDLSSHGTRLLYPPTGRGGKTFYYGIFDAKKSIHDLKMSFSVNFRFISGEISAGKFLYYGVDPFFSNLAVEEVPNHEFLLDHAHFAYVLPLSNHSSSTAKLEKRIHPVPKDSSSPNFRESLKLFFSFRAHFLRYQYFRLFRQTTATGSSCRSC